MLRFQWKLLFRSLLRVILVIVIFGEGLWHYGSTLIYFIKGYSFAELGMLYRQSGDFIYIFILVLFLAFDYFREVPDAAMLEPFQISKNYFRQDISQCLVLLSIVALYGIFFLLAHICSALYGCLYSVQFLIYLLKVAGNYILLNGMIAILFGWLLSRITGRLWGYVIITLFSYMVSPLLTVKLEYYALWIRDIFDWFRPFLIMPQGISYAYYFTLFPVNLTVASRGLIWIGLLTIGLALYYGHRKMKSGHWCILTAGLMCSIMAFLYSGLPASYFCSNNSLGTGDSTNYDQWTYMIEEQEQVDEKPEFQVVSYEMKLRLRRQMEAEVTIHPDQTEQLAYPMTLYHLYEIDQISDENGRILEYERTGDYLIVYNQGELHEICIKYHGGCANFYSNWTEVNLPGWFAYYPIPGFHEIYQDYRYMNNTLRAEAEFDIQIDAGSMVYSDLERINENHFHGFSKGPSLLAGFVREVELPGGITYIYPYLDMSYIPDMEHTTRGTVRKDYQESYEYVLERLQKDSEITFIMCMPSLAGDQAYIYEDERIIDCADWSMLQNAFEESGGFSRDYQYEIQDEETELQAIANVQGLYADLKKQLSQEELYQGLWNCYLQQMGDFGYGEEEFEAFVKEELGTEEWEYITESDNN